MLRALEPLFEGTPPAWLRKAEAAMLMRVFARAFEVEAPSLRGMSAAQALARFRSFTAERMEEVLGKSAGTSTFAAKAIAALDPVGRERVLYYRSRLGEGARSLGTQVRMLLAVRPRQAMLVMRYFYRGIAIELAGELPGELRFGPCSFANRYTPADCWLMSAFDEGFMQGITGATEEDGTSARLTFSCRLTEGTPCCHARFA